jgi:peptide/nickel transport system substrate-binding protein
MRRRDQGWARGVFLVVMAIILMTAGGIGSAGPAGRRDVVIGMIQEPDVLNSAITTTTATNFVIKAIMNYPTSYNADWRVIPWIVEAIPTTGGGDWRMLQGGRMRTLWKMRRGVKWSDGREVTAGDLAFTAQVTRHPEAGGSNEFSCGFGDKVTAVEAIDTYTVAVTWKEVFPFANTCITDGGLLPRHVLETAFNANPAKFRETGYGRDPAATVTNGPFVLRSWTRGSEMVLEANPNYWRGRPALDRVVIKFFSDANVMLANLVSGSVDVLPSGFVGLSFGQALQLEELIRQGRAPNIKVDYGRSLLFDNLYMNLDDSILKQKAVRQALVFATDRESISKSLYQGKQPPAYSLVPSNHPAYDGSLATRYAFDLKKAGALLDGAGWKPGTDGIRVNAQGQKLSIVITAPTGNRDRERVEQILQETWRKIGVDLVIENLPARVVFGGLQYQRKFKGIILASQSAGNRPFAENLEQWTSWNVRPVGETSLNTTGFKNPQADQLIRAFGLELADAKRNALLTQFQRVWADELPDIPLYWFAAATAYNKDLVGYRQLGLAAYPEPATINIFEWRWQ